MKIWIFLLKHQRSDYLGPLFQQGVDNLGLNCALPPSPQLTPTPTLLQAGHLPSSVSGLVTPAVNLWLLP